MDKEEIKNEAKETLGIDLNEKDLNEIVSSLNTFDEIEEETDEEEEECEHEFRQKLSYNLGCKRLVDNGYYCIKCLCTVKEEGEN